MPNINSDLLKELLTTFRSEASEHLQTLNRNLLHLERSVVDVSDGAAAQRQSLIQEAFRAAHSLKGAARAVSLGKIEQLAHGLESVLQLYRNTERLLEPATCDVLYATLDTIQSLLDDKDVAIEGLLQRLAALSGTKSEVVTSPQPVVVPAPEPAVAQVVTVPETNGLLPSAPPVTSIPASAPTAAPSIIKKTNGTNNGAVPEPEDKPVSVSSGPAAEETLRLSVAKLDDLMAEVGELLVSKSSAEQQLEDIRDIHEQLARWPRIWRELRMLLPQLNNDVGKQISAILLKHHEDNQNTIRAAQALTQTLNRDTMRLGMVTGQLQTSVRRMRMVPFNTLRMALERTVRDGAHTEKKQAALTIEGGETELDKKILEVLKDPLVHLLRNAIVHGLEPAEQRKALGKPVEGRIALTIQQRGSEVRIAVSDDGRGFDIQKLRTASEKSGAQVPESASASDVIGLAFLPGISTSTEITELAGRGVGLDVVKRCLEAIQGRILVDSTPGKGSIIQLVVPTSVSMTRGLVVRINKEVYVLPLLAVERILELDSASIFSIEGQPAVKLNGRLLPVAALSEILKRSTPNNQRNTNPAKLLSVIIAVADARLALLVDEVMTEQEFAVKPLGAPLRRVKNVTGAAVLGNGKPVIVLNTADLIKSARQGQLPTIVAIGQGEAQVKSARTVLVVDDSITTRTLEKNILEAAGYNVFTATDGLGALAQLEENEKIEIIVSDVQMPSMDGIALTQHLRGTNKYKEMPLILVTSLESREDRERGMLAGANAYIVKRGFDQAELLSIVDNLLGATQ